MKSISPERRIAVLGAGNGGLAAAAHLASRGASVRLFDLPAFASHFPAVRDGGIRIFGAVPEGTYRPDVITTDIAEALEGVRAVLVIIPAYGQAAFTAAMLSHLRDDHVVLLCPGAVGGALELFAELHRQRPECRALVGESANLVYAAKRVTTQGTQVAVRINGIKEAVPTAAVPAAQTTAFLAAFSDVLPGLTPARDVLDTGLNNINVVIHPLLLLANLSRADAGEEWYIFRNGFTPAVARAIEAVDAERLSVVSALGLDAVSAAEWMRRFYPDRMAGVDLYEMLSSTPVFARSLGPRTIRDRYFDEDVPYGLVPIASLARALGLPVRHTEAAVALASAAAGCDYWAAGRTLARLGVEGLDPGSLQRRVAEGR